MNNNIQIRTVIILITTYFQAAILHCIDKFDGQRSIFGIYHLLKGKKSSQTIQDGQLFGVSVFFALFPDVARMNVEAAVQGLQKAGYIKKLGAEHHYQATVSGKDSLEQFYLENPLPADLDGWQFHSFTAVFWERFTLLVQALSNIVHGVKSFYPIQKNLNIQQWVKVFLKNENKDRSDLAVTLYEELVLLLEKRQPAERDIFVMKLTGSRRTGYTNEQIGRMLGIQPSDVRFLFAGTLHYIIKTVLANQDSYPLVSSLVRDLAGTEEMPLTNSAKVTLKYIKAGRQLSEIAQIRRLKISTIEDHIVEIALCYKDFSIEPYVPEGLETAITKIAEKLGTKQLKEIKQHLKSTASYFQIRLVLAKMGDIA
ncbi:RQC domain-containing protein [Bacillus sp. M6-12]|uniref:helix-turn-helix domain-containing protein n=1 Tax=Bacillus sp. M6-12 TaxID=2054166 RepID=UPI000C763DB6|nr:helix-turn-helix domain-containing protein [Bacillus sp. M6-12]PLS16384.1 RQC domain-containing protein [Bacillus sp. M6-12]